MPHSIKGFIMTAITVMVVLFIVNSVPVLKQLTKQA